MDLTLCSPDLQLQAHGSLPSPNDLRWTLALASRPHHWALSAPQYPAPSTNTATVRPLGDARGGRPSFLANPRSVPTLPQINGAVPHSSSPNSHFHGAEQRKSSPSDGESTSDGRSSRGFVAEECVPTLCVWGGADTVPRRDEERGRSTMVYPVEGIGEYGFSRLSGLQLMRWTQASEVGPVDGVGATR